MAVDTVLLRLEGVRKTGLGRWMARCPAHDDRSPSLSVRQGDGGTVLLHCFGGCSAAEVVAAMGLLLADLFPEREHHHAPGRRVRIPAGDILGAIAIELEVVAIGLSAILSGETLPDDDLDRLRLAHRRISAAAMEANRHG